MSNVIPISKAKRFCARFKKKVRITSKEVPIKLPSVDQLIEDISTMLCYGETNSAYEQMKTYREHLGLWGFNYLLADMALHQKHNKMAKILYEGCYETIKNDPSNKYIDKIKSKLSELEKRIS